MKATLPCLILFFSIPKACAFADLVEHERHATAYSYVSSYHTDPVSYNAVWISPPGKTPSIPLSSVGIINNCQVSFKKNGEDDSYTVNLSSRDDEVSEKVLIPEGRQFNNIELLCVSYLSNKSDEDVGLTGSYIFDVNVAVDKNSDSRIFSPYIIEGKLYAKSACTLSIPEPVVNITGSAQDFQSGVSRKVKIDAACKGPSSATVFLNGNGVSDSEGCIAVKNTADDADSLRMCAAGFSFDGAKGKSLTLDKDGKSSDEIEFKLSSYNHQQPAPGEYKSVVYAVISPS
ncbi:hypothetical protein GKQ23_19480 [Erwinia sp. E602]|uniref:hypothetical protein n=1 Tax=Erwinia sp. E602 TaxID=2675378 RepID=UPI001BA80DD6|nr:hypothetical protein [Erwinia sp. E602]QUG77040.1 hypothetical protein GKQ23_19480 [Erwinia sp. E602]